MQKVKSFGAAIAVASALFAISAPAHAQATRTYVSGVGSDANPCSRTAPCKTFAGAISNTATNGIINCLDPAGYGAVTITKSLTIDCHETLGSILTGEGGSGIIINVTTADPKDTLRTVRLRNVDISGNNLGSTGVNILSATAVIMEDMSITQMTKQGILDSRTDGSTLLAVKNSIIANNGGPGVSVASQGGGVVLDNVHSIKNAFGIGVAKSNNVTINRSVFSGNSTAGLQADSGAMMTVDNSVASHNATGISGAGTITLGNTDITFNGTAISGPSTSYGNNRLFGNTAAGVGPSPAGGSAPALGQQ
jgi:hypothetical protein